MRRGRDQDRVPIGRCACRDFRPDRLARPGPVIDDDRLVQTFPELLAERTRENVRRTARHERHDETDRTCRIVGLRLRRAAERADKNE